jgi:hypothetical protein
MIIRSKRITQAAKDRSCANCGINDGTIVRAHYSGMRQHQYGKGRGIKGHDCVAADLCLVCHGKFDNYEMGEGDTKELRHIDQSEQFLHLCVMTLIKDIEEGIYKL